MKCWMLTLSLVLLLVAASTARRHRRPHDHAACKTALKPSDTVIQDWNDATLVCINEQDGLDAIIVTLGENCDDDDNEDDDDDDDDKPGRRSRRSGRKHRGHHDVAHLLDDALYTTQATTLRECRARETGRLNTDGTFNDAALQTEIKTKVSGKTIEEKTLLGITNCGTVNDFKIFDYVRCIMSYCVKGSYSPPA